MCIIAKKKLYVTMLISLLKFSRNIPKLPKAGKWFECQLRTSKGEVCLEENCMFVGRREVGVGGPKFRLFCGRHK